MKARYIFIAVVIAALYVGNINSQIVPVVQKTVLSGRDKAVLDEHFSEYAAFTIDKREIIENLYTTGTCQFRIYIDEERDWTLDLELNDMRAPEFRQTYTSDEGEFEVEEPFIVNTFKGKTSDGYIARFTIDENTFSGIILYDRHHYEIRASRDYTQNRTDESLIAYKSTDIIVKDDFLDYIDDTLEEDDEDDYEEDVCENMEREDSMGGDRGTTFYSSCTYYLKIATDADYEFYQAQGSNLNNTYEEILSILNRVEGVYEREFNMKFLVTYQHVYTTSNSTYSETESGKLLKQFRKHWNSNKKDVSRNIAHLFTGKVLSGGIGIGYTGHISDRHAYSLSRNYGARQDEIVAHEIGHNLNATHQTALPGNCECNIDARSLMCPQLSPVQQQVNNFWFCPQSIIEITSFINDKKSKLGSGISNTLTLSGTKTGFNAYRAVETITSTQEISSGYTTYEARGRIVLAPGFKVQEGARFTASIVSTDCEDVEPITVASWPEVMCTNSDGLQISVLNAVCYAVYIYAVDLSLVYRGSGYVTENPVTVCSSSAVSPGVYIINISFYSRGEKISKSYTIAVKSCSTSKSATEEEREAIEIEIPSYDTRLPYLGQNYPNPFTGETVIPYFLPEGSEKANLRIINTEGIVVQMVNITQTGESVITLAAHSLPPGVYFYSLLINGQTIDTKRMVVE